MGWDGAGGYTRVHNFSADASAGIKILATRMDAEIDDIASAFSRVWTRDGQNTPTQDLPMGGRKFVNVGAAASVSNFMRVREFIENVPIFMQDAESSVDRVSVSAQYFTSVSANQAPGDGTRILVRTNSDKSSAVLYLNGHSANIEFQDGNRATAAMVSGGIYEMIFSSVDAAWKIKNSDNGRTDAERAASITPTNVRYLEHDDRRYGNTFASGSARVKPTGFSYVTGSILHCDGPGRAVHDFDAEQEFLNTYASQSGSNEFWVDGTNGSDSNNGTLVSPFLTIAGCLQNSSGVGTIWLLPGIYTALFDVRATHNTVSAGTQARAVRIKAWAGPGSVIFRGDGQQPGEMVWALTAGTSFQYEATPSGSETAYHVIYHDGDEEIQIQWYDSQANANVASGWFQDSGTKTIYIRHQNLDLSMPAHADKFEIIYGPATNHNLQGGKVYLEGVTFRGGNQLNVYYQQDSGNDYRPVLFARHCKWQYLAYHNVAALGAHILLQDCVSEYSLGGDGLNYNDDVAAGTDQPCEVVEVDCIARYNGVPQYKDFDGDRNKQGSSGHDESVILRVNGKYYGNYGQNIADTGSASLTWMVGCELGNPWSDLQTGGDGGYDNLWTEGTAYLDSVSAGGRGSTHGLFVQSGNAALYRCEFSGTTAAIGGTGTTSLFIPMAS